MAGDSEQDPDDPDTDFVEVDPTGRYGRYREVLGKGAFKTVYRAFDELKGIEVAWNQVKLADVLRNAEDLERLYSEVHLLKTLKHKNIIKFYNSWVDRRHDNVNFITEIFTSGTLRQYRKKHKHVDLRALKNWSRQILEGLYYLHSHDPPVIHRDLKCDNIFVNGNQGEVKIGDLGLAAILQKANSAHSVIGTPEFMAPELYEEEYNELVDVYAFGMCLLELVTFEYPYVECTNAAQIFKKVTSGIKPASLEKVHDHGVRQFIEKCIAKASLRLPAQQLLDDPFLLDGENESIGRSIRSNSFHSDVNSERFDAGTNSSAAKDDVPEQNRDFIVEGQRKDVNTIFLKLRIADSTGHVRNIHFPFDTEMDTALSVATEMVSELDLTDQDVTTIAAMINSEIQAHIPEWVSRIASDDIFGGEVADSDKCDSESKDELSPLASDSPPAGSLVLERLPSGRRYWSDSPKDGSRGSPARSSPVNNSVGASSIFSERHNESPTRPSHSDFSPINESIGASSVFSEQQNELHDDEPNGEFSDQQNELHDKECNKKRREVDLPMKSQLCENQNGEHEEPSCSQNALQLRESSKNLIESERTNVRITAEKLENMLENQQKELNETRRRHQLAVSDLLKELTPEIRHAVFNMCLLKVPEYNMQCQGPSRSSHSRDSVSSVVQVPSSVSGTFSDDTPQGRRATALSTSPSMARIINRVGSQESVSDNNAGRPIYRDGSMPCLVRRDPKSSSMGIAVILGHNLDNPS